jgi:hypothetical protein
MAKTIDQLEQENAKLKQQTKELSKKLSVVEATKPANAKPIVEVGGKSYQVVSGLRTKKGDITRAALAADEKLCKELVAAGSGLLREVKI